MIYGRFVPLWCSEKRTVWPEAYSTKWFCLVPNWPHCRLRNCLNLCGHLWSKFGSKYNSIAPWFQRRLPFCGPMFKSQAHHAFINLYCLNYDQKWTKINKNRPGLAHLKKYKSIIYGSGEFLGIGPRLDNLSPFGRHSEACTPKYVLTFKTSVRWNMSRNCKLGDPVESFYISKLPSHTNGSMPSIMNLSAQLNQQNLLLITPLEFSMFIFF